ncbi:MAG: Sua5/YciO/YrdC/YwlC family protein, partial [Mucilaginibacter sp.]
METYHIHFNGIVQGVGFRPMLYLLATEMGLTGTVSNGNDGVNMVFNADEETADLFFEKIKSTLPPKANVIVASLKKTIPMDFKDFSIVTDEADAKKRVLIAPDIAMCENCKTELNDKQNRRYRYPFITCTQCGPRYSIIKSLPYERRETTMDKFVMCKSCSEEYHDVMDRRFFSQTNSCDVCGIKLRIFANYKAVLSEDTEKVLFHIQSFLRQGKIVAIKGVGGYLLLCDASDHQAIQSLRSRKRRPAKPFAVLFPDVNAVDRDFTLDDKERNLLQSPEAPIALLHTKQGAAKSLAIDQVAPGLNRVGLIIPSSPLLQLVAQDFGAPLIATSANISGSPIIYRDDDALEYLFDIASYVVTYNREIT